MRTIRILYIEPALVQPSRGVVPSGPGRVSEAALRDQSPSLRRALEDYAFRMNLLPRLAVAALLAAGVAMAHAQARPGTAERLGDAVVLRGNIDATLARRVVQLLRDPDAVRLIVTSGGGAVDATLDIAEAVHANFKNVEVPVACLGTCASYIFPAGRHKLLGRVGVVGWRGNMAYVLHQHRTGQARLPDAQLREVRLLAQREAGFYARIGVDGFVAWFAKLPPYSVEEYYSLSLEEMEGFGIRNLRVQETESPLTGGLVQQVQVDWPHLEALRPRWAPDP
jgi:hypothetical protein